MLLWAALADGPRRHPACAHRPVRNLKHVSACISATSANARLQDMPILVASWPAPDIITKRRMRCAHLPQSLTAYLGTEADPDVSHGCSMKLCLSNAERWMISPGGQRPPARRRCGSWRRRHAAAPAPTLPPSAQVLMVSAPVLSSFQFGGVSGSDAIQSGAHFVYAGCCRPLTTQLGRMLDEAQFAKCCTALQL